MPVAIPFIIAALFGVGAWELAKKLKGWFKMSKVERQEVKKEALLLLKAEKEKVLGDLEKNIADADRAIAQAEKDETASAKTPRRAKAKV